MAYKVITNFVIAQIEESGYARVEYKVDGFWSSSQITVYIDRRYNNESWRFSYTNSSGGQDDSADISDTQRMYNYATAMNAAADVLRFWEKNVDALDEAYETFKINSEKRRIKEAQEAQERADKEEADRIARVKAEEHLTLGEGAKAYIENAAKEAKENYWFGEKYRLAGNTTHLKHIADEYNWLLPTFEAKKTNTGRISFYINGGCTSKKDAIEYMKDAIIVSKS